LPKLPDFSTSILGGSVSDTQCLSFFVFNANMLPVFKIEKFTAQPWQVAMLFATGES